MIVDFANKIGVLSKGRSKYRIVPSKRDKRSVQQFPGLVLKRTKGLGHRRCSFTEMLHIGMLKTKARKVIANIMQCSSKTVARVQLGLAQAFLATRDMWMKWMLFKLRDPTPPRRSPCA